MQNKNSDTTTIGKRIELVVETLYGSKTRFAETLGIHKTALDKYIRGQAKLGSTWQIRFEKLGVNWAWLMTGKGKMFGSSKDSPSSGEIVIRLKEKRPPETVAAVRMIAERLLNQASEKDIELVENLVKKLTQQVSMRFESPRPRNQ